MSDNSDHVVLMPPTVATLLFVAAFRPVFQLYRALNLLLLTLQSD